MKHDFLGCPSRCLYCEVPLLSQTKDEDCPEMTPNNTPLDLDKLEAEVKEDIADGTAGLAERKMAWLISELRQAKQKLNQEAVESDMRAEQRNGLSRENILLRERLQSAEDALHPFAFYEEGKISTFLNSYTELARAHFAKWGKV